MKTLTKIWNFLKSKTFIILLILALIGYSAGQYSLITNLKRQQSITEQNVHALKDSLTLERKKSGELLVSISGYVATEKELKVLNKNLYDKVKAQSGKIVSLNNSVIQLIQDTTMLRKYLAQKDAIIEAMLKINDSTFVAGWTLPFKYDENNYDIFTGKTYIGVGSKEPLILVHNNTELVKRITQIDLTWGQKIEKGKLKIFIESKYPGFSVTQLEGVFIDPNTNPYIKDLMKKRKWFTGFGAGIGTTVGYDIFSGNPGMVIGATVMYNIYQF